MTALASSLPKSLSSRSAWAAIHQGLSAWLQFAFSLHVSKRVAPSLLPLRVLLKQPSPKCELRECLQKCLACSISSLSMITGSKHRSLRPSQQLSSMLASRKAGNLPA